MLNGAEKVNNLSEADKGQQKHPLEQMPSFEEHMRKIKSSEVMDDSEKLNASDKTIDNLFDKVGREAGKGYFEKPDVVFDLAKDALSLTPQQAISNFKGQVEAYRNRSTESYRQRAAIFYEQTRDNVQKLAREHSVGNDTIKVFLDPNYISEKGRGMILSEYNVVDWRTYISKISNAGEDDG